MAATWTLEKGWEAVSSTQPLPCGLSLCWRLVHRSAARAESAGAKGQTCRRLTPDLGGRGG